MIKLTNLERKYENYRWFFTSNNILVVGGKSDSQNEVVLTDFLKPNYIVFHTSLPGSPFMVIQSESPGKKDIEEAAIFCACLSQQWKRDKKLIDIDIFKGEQIYKTNDMKTGTFGVKGKKKTIKVKPELVLVIQNGKLRAVPDNDKYEKIAEIKQGNLTKEQAAEKIFKIIKDKYHFPITKDEIMQAIPSGKLSVK
jgi:hypothetical protein